MQWLYLITALLVGFGLGHFVCWLGQGDTATDAALVNKIPGGLDPGVYVTVQKRQHEKLLMLWHFLRPGGSYDPVETLDITKARIADAEQDTRRLMRLNDYHNGKRPVWTSHRNDDPLGELRNRIDKWPEEATSRIKVEHTQLRRALELYVGKPEEFGNPFGHMMQRHHFIQEQANQCGYSTILYSLSPSSSIFTPNYVNGFQQFAQQPAPSCVEPSTSSACVLKNAQRSGGSSRTVCLAHPRTHCPSCHRPMLTNYRQKCIPCRIASRPIP